MEKLEGAFYEKSCMSDDERRWIDVPRNDVLSFVRMMLVFLHYERIV